MKAIVFDGFNKVKIEDKTDPVLLKVDDAIIKVTLTSICGSDLHLVHGMEPSLSKGFILGHETIGIVEEKGINVTRVNIGDRVIVPFPISCGHCAYCNEGMWSMCDNSNGYGGVGAIYGAGKLYGNYQGGQAEYLKVPYANTGLIKIPEHLSDEQVIFLTDILPSSYWGAINANVKSGDTVTVLGCGPVGLLTIKWCIFMGAKRIIAVDCVEHRLEHARRYGVEAYNFKTLDDAGEFIKEITNGGTDSVIDCVGMDGKTTFIELIETVFRKQGGSKSAIEMASQAVRKGGVVSIIGTYGARYNKFPLGDFFSRNITLKMGQCPVQSYISKIMDYISENSIDPTDIITHRLSLDEAVHAYEIFDKKSDDCIKVLLKP